MPPFSRTTPPSKISITFPFKYAIILFPCYYSLCRTRIIKHLRDVEAPSPTAVRIFVFSAKLSYCSGFAGRRGAVPYGCKTFRFFSQTFHITPVLRDVEAPSPTSVRQLSAILTTLAFRFGEWKPLAVKSNHSCLPLWGRGTACGGRGLSALHIYLIENGDLNLFV